MNKKIIKRIYNVVIILCFIGAIGWCFSHFYHGSDVVYTDDAQVNRHITPINTRVSGFIKEIRFSDYQHVKKGTAKMLRNWVNRHYIEKIPPKGANADGADGKQGEYDMTTGYDPSGMAV